MTPTQTSDLVRLPAPARTGGPPLTTALAARRSIRNFAQTAPTIAQIGQLLWAALGLTGPAGERTAPSAGALHPLEIHLVAGEVAGLAPGLYRYRTPSHDLALEHPGDFRGTLCAASLGQEWVRDAPALLVLAARPVRTERQYGDRGPRYLAMEVGCVAQNVALQAAALGLGTVLVGAFEDAKVRRVLRLPAECQALALLPLGKPA